jgi:hypothetical protein
MRSVSFNCEQAVGPLDQHPIGRPVAQPEVHANVARAQVTPIGMDAAPEGRAALPQHGHAGADSIVIALHSLEANFEPVAARLGLVQQQTNRPVVVRNHDVGAAIVVDIAKRGAASDFRELKRRARFAAGLSKLCALVMQQQIPLMKATAPLAMNKSGRPSLS